MKKIMSILILGIFFISLVGALDLVNLGTFKAGENVTLYQNCPSCTFVNITSVITPNGIITFNDVMDNVGTEYFYNFTNTSAIGDYTYSTLGDKDTILKQENILFSITPTGDEFTTAKGNLIIGTFLILIFAIAFFLVLGIFCKNVPFQIFFIGLSILFMVTTIGFSVSVWQQVFGTFGNLVETYGRIYILLTILIIGGGIGLFVYLVYMAILNFYDTGKLFGNEDD